MLLAAVAMLHYLHKFRCLEQVIAGFVAFVAGFQHQPLLWGSIVALLAGFLYKCYWLWSMEPYAIAAAPIVFGLIRK
ncbi:hypothetical protein [Paenibacillus sp. FSL P2-0136]|uniref:hypothetical protein n=1 Tax=Paenibacillus sp. FSL P2-0136 TaxID=2975317 RepID=UPI0030D991F4